MNINKFYFEKIKNLSRRFMKAGIITYSRWVTYRGQKHVIKARLVYYYVINILFCDSLDVYKLNGLFVKSSFVSWVPDALKYCNLYNNFNLISWDMNAWSTTKSKIRHYYNLYDKKLKTNLKHYRTNMIPVNSSYFGWKEVGRGSVVFCSRRRDLSTCTYKKITRRKFCNIIQDKLYWSSKSKNVQIPNGSLKIHNEFRSLYERNLINANWINHDLFRLLRYTELWIIAYYKLSKKPGSMTSDLDKYTIDGTSLKTIKALQNSVLSSIFKWGEINRIYIPKPNGKERSLGIPKFQDILVQNVIKEILEKIYEPKFSNNSHGFRYGKSQHTALKDIRKYFVGVIWFIEGDIFSFYDSINHNILMTILSERIQDKKILNLIKLGLKSDILLPNGVFIKNNIIGTPQGGILSPLLSNIYLDKLDKFIENKKIGYDKGYRSASNKENTKLVRAYGAVKYFPNELKNIHSVDPFDNKFKRIHYVRYADKFIIGIIGNKDEAVVLRDEIKEYLKINLDLILNKEKTLITHRSDIKKFLGYTIGSKEVMYKHVVKDSLRDSRRQLLTLFVDIEKIIKKLCLLGYCDKGGNPVPNFKLLHQTQSVTNFNATHIINGLNAYYKLANNRNRAMTRIIYILKTSIAKMYAAKYKKRTRAAIFKIAGPNLNRRIRTKNPLGTTEFKLEEFAGSLEEIIIPKICLPKPVKYNKPDLSVHYTNADKLIFDDIFKNIYSFSIRGTKALNMPCYVCGSVENVEMHHVRKISDIKTKDQRSKVMIAVNRKQLPLCKKHHYEVHGRKYKG